MADVTVDAYRDNTFSASSLLGSFSYQVDYVTPGTFTYTQGSFTGTGTALLIELGDRDDQVDMATPAHGEQRQRYADLYFRRRWKR